MSRLLLLSPNWTQKRANAREVKAQFAIGDRSELEILEFFYYFEEFNLVEMLHWILCRFAQQTGNRHWLYLHTLQGARWKVGHQNSKKHLPLKTTYGFQRRKDGMVWCRIWSPTRRTCLYLYLCFHLEYIHPLLKFRCVTSFKLNSERARDVDFSMPFLETGISILVKIRSGVLSPTAFLGAKQSEKSIKLKCTFLVEPFEYSTWIVILVVSIQGAALSIFLFEWLSPNSYDMKNYPPPGWLPLSLWEFQLFEGHKFSICRSYWLVWATLFSASVNTGN